MTDDGRTNHYDFVSRKAPTSDEVSRLVAARFAEYRDRVWPLPGAGTDNWLYRVGNHAVARFPRSQAAEGLGRTEVDWLSRLQPLPLETPQLIGRGEPSATWPHDWSLWKWIPGRTADTSACEDLSSAAKKLAAFLAALQAKSNASGPLAGATNNGRGVPLLERESLTQIALRKIGDEYDLTRLQTVWAQAVTAPVYRQEPVWIHGDLHAANFVLRDHELSAVIDFGLMGLGDPAVDLIFAWSFLDPPARTVLRDNLTTDAATWMRGRGWALSTAAIALAYYRGRHAYMETMSRRVIASLLDEQT